MGSKISQLTEATNLSSGNDQVEIIIDTETTPLNRRIKFLNLLKRLFLGDGTQLTITTIADGEFLKRSGTNITSGVPSGTGLGGSTGGTDNAILRADGTGGATAQGSAILIDDGGAFIVPEMVAPSTPATNKVAVYAKSDGKLYIKDDAGTETDLTATGAAGAETGVNSDITSMDGLTGPLRAPTQIEDGNGNEVLKFGSTSSAINEVTITNKAAGTAPSIEATGGDTNIGLNLKSKGSGTVQANGLDVATSNVVQSLTDGATVTWATSGVQFPNAVVTLGGNRTLAITGAISGQSGTLIVKQDGTGSRTLTLPSGSKVRDGGSGAVTLSTAANSVDILSYLYDGTNYFWTYAKNYN